MKSMQQMGEAMIRCAAAEREASGSEWPKAVLVGHCIAIARNQQEFDECMKTNRVLMAIISGGLGIIGIGALITAVLVIARSFI